MKGQAFLCIDLKSFFASVECVERGLDPMTSNLVVADPSRTEKTICLAVSPAMKKLGVKNRCRVFEIPKNIDYITAPPRMSKYIEYSAKIYSIYLKYVSKEDIHVYSIDEVFIDITPYMSLYKLTPKELAVKMINDVLNTTGITAACGIGTNLYLAKIAMDITAKHSPDNIGVLDEISFMETLWDHKPLTDFWRIGPATQKKLAGMGINNMRQLAHYNEKKLYKAFGIDAELMIDHAWGRETTTMADIKAYRPTSQSLDRGQVLSREYNFEECKIIVREMTELLCLELVDKGLSAKTAVLHLGVSGLMKERASDRGSVNFGTATSSYKEIMPLMMELYDKTAKKENTYRRVSISFTDIAGDEHEQFDLFCDPQEKIKEKNMQKAILSIKKKYGKNAMIKGMDLQEGATTIERNGQIGGHRSGD